MWKKIVLGVVIVVLGGLGLAWLNREAVVLFIAAHTGKQAVAEHRQIDWQQGPLEETTSPLTRAPNVIFILADDLGYNDISTFGGGVADGAIQTPNIDRLAREGVIFTNAYSGTASCAPSRAMLMTGRYPTRTGFEFTPTPNGMGRVISLVSGSHESVIPPIEWSEAAAATSPPFEEQGLPGSEVTLAEVLGDAGYHTVHIGKWHLGRGPEFGPNAQGFDESLLMASGLYLPEDDPGVVNARLDFDPVDKFLWAKMQYAVSYNESDWFEPGGYLTDYWTQEAQSVIRANRDRPFFLYLAHWGVHTPLQATREDYEAVGDIQPHRLRVYAAMIRALDRSVGNILDTLDEEGLAENTIVIFSSDNGGPGYIGLPDINEPYRGWKLTLFEGGIRVPLFMRWPARIDAGQEVSAPAAHIDLLPTLASACGAPLPEGVEIDGRDLLGVATGEAEPGTDKPIFWQSAYYQSVRRGDWKLQISQRPDKVWLYDLSGDPTEQINIASERPDIVAELTALLDAHQQGARESLYPFTLEGPVAVDQTLAEDLQPGAEVIYWPN
ncbi:sulfatase [Henriciella barbarensis]|uniref:Sulfatase n=1 Tax=Henriciella barbarensis TaxID=86342 RepID=A0A399QVX2_9PROT|nr:sulfatase [Henriciella barbarensis]RIJ21652.1 sulfatase [Henriciella barbarensis]